jgi:CBS domain-containing protein
MLADGYFPQHFKTWSPAECWLVGAAAALLLFVTVLIHELSHSLVAQAQGLPVSSITLYLFGGVSNLSKEPESAGDEFWMAFPLDGGRVLHSIAWALTHDRSRATRIATSVGQGFGWLLMLLGMWIALAGNFLSGIWLVLIGWFLHNAALASSRQASQTEQFETIEVADVMATSPTTVLPDIRLDSAIRDYLFHQSERALPVVRDGQLVGLLSITDIRHFEPDQWSVISVQRAMTPVERLDTVGPKTRLVDALQLMAEHKRNELPVVEDGQLVGFLSHADVVRYLQLRRELGLDRRPRSPHLPGHGNAA